MTWEEAITYLREYNKKHNITTKGMDGPTCVIVAVISEDSFTMKYSLEERSYAFSNNNKAFMDNLGYSIFADSLDGYDRGVRLEQYVGNRNGWKVDYCYIKSED